MEQYKVNDVHVHIGKSTSVNRNFINVDILSMQQTYGIEKSLVFSAEDDPLLGNCQTSWITQDDERIFGLWWINNNDRREQVPLNNKILGAKYHGSYTGYPIKPSQLLADLEKEQAILMVHCGRYKEGRMESNTSYQHALEIAKIYPKLKVIMAHMGGTDTNVCKVAINDSQNYDNVYFDTSGITTPYIIEYAISKIPSKRILFGSDAPWCSFRAMYYTVLDAQIPTEDKENIFYNSFNDLIKKCVSVQTR